LIQQKWLKFALRVSVTLLLLAFLLKSISWSVLLRTLTHVQPAILSLGLAVGVFGVIVGAFQWQVILKAEEIHVALLRLVKLYLVGIGFSHFLPTGMGGDLLKAFYVGRDSGKGAASVSAVIMTRVTGFLGMLLLAVPALILWHQYFTKNVIAWFVLLSLGITSLIGGVVFVAHLLSRFPTGGRAVPHALSLLMRIGEAISVSARRPHSMWMAMLIGLILWVVNCLNYYSYGVALGIQIPLYFYFVAIPFVALVTLVPISINGFGVRETFFVYVFSTVHVPAASSLLLVFLMDLQVLLSGVIGGCLYLTLSSKANIAK
jgi:glycosyltransferase 2 family protein